MYVSKLQVRHVYQYSKPKVKLFPPSDNRVSFIFRVIDKIANKKKTFSSYNGIDEDVKLVDIT